MGKKIKRTGYKHGESVQEPVPHADITKYVDKKTYKADDRRKTNRVRTETMEFKKPKQRRQGQAGRPKGGWTA